MEISATNNRGQSVRVVPAICGIRLCAFRAVATHRVQFAEILKFRGGSWFLGVMFGASVEPAQVAQLARGKEVVARQPHNLKEEWLFTPVDVQTRVLMHRLTVAKGTVDAMRKKYFDAATNGTVSGAQKGRLYVAMATMLKMTASIGVLRADLLEAGEFAPFDEESLRLAAEFGFLKALEDYDVPPDMD